MSLKFLQYLKSLALVMLLSLPLAGRAQNHAFVITDTAQYIVDQYLRLLAFDELPEDSLLVLETTVILQGSADTLVIRRWYQPGERFRYEIWHDGKLLKGYLTNGDKRHRHYNRYDDTWTAATKEEVERDLRAYDFRGPLYRWREKGATLTWNGTTTLMDHTLQVVKVSCPDFFDRYYMFDPLNGLLTFIFESDKMMGEAVNTADFPSHIEWKSIHEYQPVGSSLIPSLESFMRNGNLTVLATTVHLEPTDGTFFNRDER